MPSSKQIINVCICQPLGDIHSLALLEAAQYVVAQAAAAGHEAHLRKNRVFPAGLNIVFGAHAIARSKPVFPGNTVIFNTEPASSALWNAPEYRHLLNTHLVWDSSPNALEAIEHGNKQLFPFLHCEPLDRIPRAPSFAHDLIFCGTSSDRQRRILDGLRAAGLTILEVSDLYAAERDALLPRARAMLHLHSGESPSLEPFRLFYPLTNGVPVVSENFLPDSAPAIYADALFAPGHEPLERYLPSLLGNPAAFESAAMTRLARWREHSEAGSLRTALETAIEAVGRGSGAPSLPRKINLGSGKDYRPGYLNIDVVARNHPDILFDLCAADELPVSLISPTYGPVELAANRFDEILAFDVLEHVGDLPRMMTRCLDLLANGGRFVIQVPYDLSHGAWQDPTHIRAFNENSWLYYTDWFWYLGWFEHRFDCLESKVNFAPIGQEMAQRKVPLNDILRTPRAVDSMSVVLVKRATTPQEKTQARAFGNSFDAIGEASGAKEEAAP